MKQFEFLLITLLLLFFCIGCTNDNDWQKETPLVEKENEVLLQLEMMVPGISTPETYALTEADENELKTIDLLVFKDNGAGNDETFLYRTHATDIDNNSGSTSKKFKALIQKSTGSDKHRIVLVANARNQIDAVSAGFATSNTKAEILEMITFDTDVKWNTTSSSNFTALPMWGETTATHTITATTTGVSIGTIKMLRSVARIDVGLSIDNNDVPQGFGTRFKLSDVKVYNANKKSQVVPQAGNITANKATLPSLVATPQAVSPAIAYAHSPADFGFVREIYVGEADNKTQTDDDKMFCVVIGGYYTKDGDLINTTDKTWYRIDFYKRDSDPQERLDILRNHRYKVNITAVDGPGYETETDAFNSRPINVDAEIIVWDEADMNDHTSDGQYELTVDENEITLYEEGNLNPQKLGIYTDHPGGWKIDYDGITWIQVTPANDNSGNKVIADVTADPYLLATDPREAGFWIKAGKMKKWIKVIQLNEPELTIDVTPTQIIFRKSGSQAKSIVVTTYPATSQVNFSVVQGANPISWMAGTGFPVSGLQNIGTYTFQPSANNSGNVLSATVMVSTTDAVTGMMVSKNVTITQLATDLFFGATVNNPYPATAGTYTFLVNSDTKWSILSVSDPDNALAGAFDNTVKDIGAATVYSFPLTANNTWSKKEVVFTPTSSDLDFSGQPIPIEQNNVNPSLTLNKASIDFGNAATPAANSVMVTSNAKWKYTTSGDWANVVATASVAANTESGSHSYHTSSTNAVNFTAKQWTPVAGTPAAGTTYTATAEFTTSDHAPAAAATNPLTIKRIVPNLWENPKLIPLSEPLPRTGAYVDVEVFTNAKWVRGYDLNVAGHVTTNASPYGKQTGRISIGENTGWGARIVYVALWNRYIDNIGQEVDGTYTGKHISQNGYYISGISSSLPTPAASGGTNASVSVTGAFPAIQVKAVVNGTSTQVSNATPSIAACESSTGTGTFIINANTTWSSRNVICQYLNPRNNTWTNVGSAVIQQGYAVTNATANTVAAADGGNCTVNLTGYRPTLNVRATGTQNGTIPGTVNGAAMGSTSTTLVIPKNLGNTTKSITIQYQHPINGWTNITSFTQQGQNWIDLGTHWGHPQAIPDNVYTYAELRDGQACVDMHGPGWFTTNTSELCCSWQKAGFEWSVYGRWKYEGDYSNRYHTTQLNPNCKGVGSWFFKENSLYTGAIGNGYTLRCVRVK